MVNTALGMLGVVLAFAFTFWLMGVLWRRMRKVQGMTREDDSAPVAPSPAWEEPDYAGRYTGRGFDVNDGLIESGARQYQNPSHIIDIR